MTSTEVETPVNVEESENGEAAEGETAQTEGAVQEQPASATDEAKKLHPVGRTVFIKNLPVSMLLTYKADLKERFEKYGDIAYIKLGGITVDYTTTMPSLSAIINYFKPESSDKAMEENGKEINGNILSMQILKSDEYTVVANNIPFVISDTCLKSIFSPCGEIKKIVKIPARPTAFIEFENEEGMNKALSLNGEFHINNCEIILHKQGAVRLRDEFGNKAKSKVKSKGGKAWRSGPVSAPPAPVMPPPSGYRGGRGRGGRGGGPPRGGGGPIRGGRGMPMGGGWMGGGGRGNQFNSWGNGNYSNNDGPRGFPRSKQSEWWHSNPLY